MNPEQPTSQDSPAQTSPNPLIAMQPGEQIICEIKRHPIGLMGLYISVGFYILVMLGALMLVPHYLHSVANIQSIMLGIFFVVTVSVLLYALTARFIYLKNRWFVTSDSITQVQQTGLFRRQTSQLSLANLEDVTAVQNGFIQTMIKYGTLRAETAGEKSKFVFPFCPNPNFYAQKILTAREEFIRNDPVMAKRANDKLSVPMAQAPENTYSGPISTTNQL